MALAPAPEHLPALSGLIALTERAVTELLQRVQSGAFRTLERDSKHPERSIRNQHPGLWRQLRAATANRAELLQGQLLAGCGRANATWIAGAVCLCQSGMYGGQLGA